MAGVWGIWMVNVPNVSSFTHIQVGWQVSGVSGWSVSCSWCYPMNLWNRSKVRSHFFLKGTQGGIQSGVLVVRSPLLPKLHKEGKNVHMNAPFLVSNRYPTQHPPPIPFKHLGSAPGTKRHHDSDMGKNWSN